MTMDEHYNWEEEEGLVSMDIEVADDYVMLFIGTQQPIAEVKKLVQKTYYNQAAGYPDWGRPIYPYEQLPVFEAEDGGRYILSGQVAPTIKAEQTDGEIDYSLGVNYYRYPGDYHVKPDQVLTSELNTFSDEELPSYFHHHPRIFWQGDINGDQMPDLIFYQPNVSECCGGSESFFLLMSEQKAGNWEWHRVADDRLESWGGC